MSRSTIARGIAIGLVAVGLLGLAAPAPALAPSGGSSSPALSADPALRVGVDAWQLLKLTNASRERHGLAVLRLDRERSILARKHSRKMAAAGELFHSTDVSPYLVGVDWHRWGENVGYTPGTLEGLHDAFMASKPHRHNVLEADFRRVAIGAVRADGVLWVTLFFYG
jgi:uncharacterized protein YkwD